MDLTHILDDRELFEELRDKRRDLTESSGLEAARTDSLERAVRTMRESPGAGLPEGLEAIIHKFGRPALLVQHGKYVWQQDATKSEVWEARLAAASDRLSAAIPAVGRIDVRNHPRARTWVGTGWLVANDVVVTNRHVAVQFARHRGERFEFRYFMHRMVTPSVDLRHEHEVRDSVEFNVERVLWIGGEDEPDVAFLQVNGTGQRIRDGERSEVTLPAPVPLANEAVPAGRRIAAIGYPAFDSRNPADRHRIFGDIFNVKRLQPGEILSSSDTKLTHDCSTLGGNSGSVLLDLNRGDAVGLHFSGAYWTANHAVPAAVVRQLLEDKLDSAGPASNVRRAGFQRQESKLGLQRAVTRAPMLSGPKFRWQWARAERRVCRIDIDLGGHASADGTGFLIGPDLVLTNAHVMGDLLHSEGGGAGVTCRFEFADNPGERAVKLADAWLVAWSPFSPFDPGDDGGLPGTDELDYAVLRLAERIGADDDRGWFELEDPGLPEDGSWLTIIQHPLGGPQASALNLEAVLCTNDNGTRIRHKVNTEPGSSGSPCFDSHWNLVALHHAGDPNFDPGHKPEYNQAIPIGLIRQDLKAQGLYPFTVETSTQPIVSFPLDKFLPTLIILCSGEHGQAKAQALIEEAQVPPSFVSRIGNQPPVDVSANAIALFLGDQASVQDTRLLETVNTLRGQHLQIIPVVEDLDDFYQHTPEVLHDFNAEVWRPGADPPEQLRGRIRQLLGLEVDPAHRKVFITDQPPIHFHHDKFLPTLIILCSGEHGQAKAQALIEEAQVPPSFVARKGNQPPVDVSANAIALFLGDQQSVQDGHLLETVRTLRGQHLQIIPVVEDLDDFYQHTPKELHNFNAEVWRPGSALSERLRGRIRQLLGLEVDPAHRKVFISYSRRDSREEVAELGDLLRKRGYDVFIDLEDLPLGDPVQATIERQISGRYSLLYFETANASRSDWIYAELKWAYTRGLALVVFQRGRVRSRHELIQSLPVTYSTDTTPIADEVERLVDELDLEIAQASTRCVQLGRTVEAIIESHSQGRNTTVEIVGSNRIRATFETAVLDQVNRRRLLFWCVPHRPATPLIKHLVKLHDEQGVDGAALIYEAPEDPLTDEQEDTFRKLRDSRLLFWIERQNLSKALSELITALASRGNT